MKNPRSKIAVGMPVKYSGDCMNHPGKGRVTNILTSLVWPTQYEITLEAEPSDFGEEYGLPERIMWVPAVEFDGADARFSLEAST